MKVGDEAIEKQPTQVKKEQPSWLTKSTVDGVDNLLLSSTQVEFVSFYL